MPMRPWSGWIRAISPMAMPQLPWMDGMSQRSLQQADGKTWMSGKPSWAEPGKLIWGMCRGLMTETLWIVSRSRRGNVQPASCVFWLLTVFSCLKFLTTRASPKKSHVGTWLRNLIIPTVFCSSPCIPPFLFVFAHVLPPKFFQISRAQRPWEASSRWFFPGIEWLNWDGQSDWCRREFEVVGSFTMFLRRRVQQFLTYKIPYHVTWAAGPPSILDTGDHRWTGAPGAMTSSTSFSMTEPPGLHAFDFQSVWFRTV